MTPGTGPQGGRKSIHLSRQHLINVNGKEVRYRPEGHLTICLLPNITRHRGRD
jgi:hypothetical protein